MSNRRDDEVVVAGVNEDSVYVSAPVAAISPVNEVTPGTVVIENLVSVEVDITLTDGTNLHLMPAQSGKGLSKSRPIPRKLIPAYVKRLTTKGDLKITAATEK